MRISDWSSDVCSSDLMVWAATEALAESRGSVVCISSICGLEALGCPIAYAGAKAALESFVHNSARPPGQRGVRINSVAPGTRLFSGSVWGRNLQEERVTGYAMLEREVTLGCRSGGRSVG